MSILNFYYNFFQLVKSKLLLLSQVCFAFLLPIKPLIFLVALMIFLDTITGIIKAKKLKQKITSSKLSLVISKMVLYQVSLITFFILDKHLIGEFVSLFISIPFFLTKLVAIFLVTVELVSMNENFKEVTGMNIFEMFKNYLKRAKELKSEIKDITEK